MEEKWTILRVLRWTTGYFSSKGIEQPRADAEVLLAHVLGWNAFNSTSNYDKHSPPMSLPASRTRRRRAAPSRLNTSWAGRSSGHSNSR